MEDGAEKATTPDSSSSQAAPPALSAVYVNRPLVAGNRAMAAVHVALVATVIVQRGLALLSAGTGSASPASRSLQVQHVAMALADLTLLFLWALSQSGLWRPVTRAAFPGRLLAAVPRGALPRVDVLVVTADPDKEPPLGVVNTVVSAMALDYPGGKLSVYLSDDAGSPLTLLAARKAYAFAARAWVPFCRRHSVQCPWPDRYFAGDDDDADGDRRREELAEERARVRVHVCLSVSSVLLLIRLFFSFPVPLGVTCVMTSKWHIGMESPTHSKLQSAVISVTWKWNNHFRPHALHAW
jgi:hypothetical protein